MSNGKVVDNWIKDGEPQVEPVTVETPPEETTPVEAGADETVGQEPQEVSAISQEEKVPASTPSEPEMFVGRLGEEEHQIPKDFLVPLKRGEEVEYVPLTELQSRGMMEKDYRLKTAELAEQRRQFEKQNTDFAANQARVEARDKWLQEREAEMREAQQDPQKWEAYQESMRLYKENPRFRQTMDDALAKRETDAENAVYREREEREAVQEGVNMARSWIDELTKDPQYEGVNAVRVAEVYGNQLRAGTAPLSREAVQAVVHSEAQYLSQSLSPLQKQLESVQSQLNELTEQKKAETHNESTEHALARGKAPNVAPKGTPPAPAPKKKIERFGMRDLADVNAQWSRGEI
jgi:hypothetical protein